MAVCGFGAATCATVRSTPYALSGVLIHSLTSGVTSNPTSPSFGSTVTMAVGSFAKAGWFIQFVVASSQGFSTRWIAISNGPEGGIVESRMESLSSARSNFLSRSFGKRNSTRLVSPIVIESWRQCPRTLSARYEMTTVSATASWLVVLPPLRWKTSVGRFAVSRLSK